MNAGKLTTQIIIQSKTITQDAELNAIETPATFKTVWAEPLAQTSREFYRLAMNNAEVTKVFRIRYVAGITAQMIVLYKSVSYQIIGPPENEGDRDISLLIACKANV